jgi:protein-S-isoprenylcysteine O-methyltransferase Ste14
MSISFLGVAWQNAGTLWLWEDSLRESTTSLSIRPEVSLSRYFSGVIGVQQGQKVVGASPYRLVRHPSYAGALLILIGIAASMLSMAAVAAAFLLFWLGYGYRMLVEEKVLV